MGSTRRRRAGLAALVVPALLLAAFAAASYRPFGGEREGERAVSTTFVDAVFTLAAVALVAAVVALVWVRRRAPKVGMVTDVGQLSLTAFLVFVVVVTLAVVVIRHGLRQPPPVPEGEEDLDPAFPTLTDPEARPRPDAAADARAPRFVWPLAGGVAALVAAAAVAAIVVRRRRTANGELSADQLELVGARLDEAIDDLRREPDPRRAVVAAYARMEQALAVLGLPRDRAEAPYEYLARVGRRLDAEGSVAELTDLFERAKFSDHGVGEPMRERAIEALVAVRDDVRRAV